MTFIELYITRQSVRKKIKKLRAKVDFAELIKLREEEKALTVKIEALLEKRL